MKNADMKPNKISLNRDQIKYAAVVAMVLNHIAHALLTEGTILAQVFIKIGGLTAITMCYFLAEGYRYTHSKKQYAIRLGTFALASQIPFHLCFCPDEPILSAGLNMLFNLLGCFLILLVLDKVSNQILKIAIIFFLILFSSICDWSVAAPIFVLLFTWAQDSERKKKIAFLMCAGLGFALNLYWLFYTEGSLPGACVLDAALDSCILLIAGAVILYLYNGKQAAKGRKFSKWFFYAFYPGHLAILALIRFFITK